MAGITRSGYRAQSGFSRDSTYGRKFTAGFERALDVDTTLTVEYMNIAGFHLPRLRNAALTLPPQFLLEQSAHSTFSGVTVTMRRRMSSEFSYLLAYTAGAAYDDASDYNEQPLNL